MRHVTLMLIPCSMIGALILSCLGCASTASPTSISTLARPASNAAAMDTTPPTTLLAHHTTTPVKIDGKLDEPIWQTATAYPLHAVTKGTLPNYPLQETALIRLAWDDEYLYVAGDFQDADIVDNSKADQQFLYSTGDTMELFLKPSARRWYWEFYGTPRGSKTTLFYPSRGRFGLNPWPYHPGSGLKVGSQYQGSLNNWNDRDQGFIIEMAIPRKELARDGQRLVAQDSGEHGAGTKARAADEADIAAEWTILVTRYNFSAFSDTFQAELSTTPRLKIPNFHVYEDWARLKLVR